MIFQKEGLSFTLLDVIFLNQKDFYSQTLPRSFHAISYRLHATARIVDKTGDFPLSDRTVCFVPAGTEYRREAKNDELIVVHFFTTNYTPKGIECFEAKDPEKYELLFRQILTVWREKKSGFRYEATALLYRIFAECYRDNAEGRTENEKIANSIAYLKEHFTDPTLTIGDLAARSYMSEVYLRKLFKRETGYSPQKYLIRMRIGLAESLIHSGYYSLKEIAHRCGYNDYRYFATEFKRYVGVSPSVYRYREWK